MDLVGKQKADWPRGPYSWIDNRVLFMSIPFTWNLPAVRKQLRSFRLGWDTAIVGGPATRLLPNFLEGIPGVVVGLFKEGVLQRINPLATRTTTGCIRHCKFCAIGTGAVESGGLVELDDWPDLPIICDNNLLAASQSHFDKVIDRLVRWGWADFNQGLDARLLIEHHAIRLAEIKQPLVRLALDSNSEMSLWEHAFVLLRHAGIAKNNIRSYCLIGFRDSPKEAWERCQWVQAHGVLALPMWFHSLGQLEANIVTDEQKKLGWSEYEQSRIMGWFYKHRGTPLVDNATPEQRHIIRYDTAIL